MTRKAAYIGSIALAAKMIGTLSPNLKNNASTSTWSSYLQFIQSFDEAKSNPHLRLQEDFHLSDIWESSAPKLQAIIKSRKCQKEAGVVENSSEWKTPCRNGDCGCILGGAAGVATTGSS
jgi:hypothetical protein